MTKRKAVTHADLAPSQSKTDLCSKIGVISIVFTVLCGLLFFILCLISEATRSEMIWVGSSSDKGRGKDQCVYSGSGKTPLLCGASAFVGLAIAMVVEHTCVLIAISKLPASDLTAWEPNSASDNALTWQAGLFFIATWICFAVGEILLLIGLSVESGHLKNWSKPKPNCFVLRQGLFSAAGVFALTSVFLYAGLYLTTLRVQSQTISSDQENVRREVLAASALYASPPLSPPHHIGTVTRENPIVRDNCVKDW